MRPRDGVPGVPESHAGKPGPLPHGTEPDSGLAAGAPSSRCRAVPGSASPSTGLSPHSPPPHPLRRGRARCGGGRARRGLACPRRGGKLSWEKLGAAGVRPEVGTRESSGAREGAEQGGETPRPPGHEVQSKRVSREVAAEEGQGRGGRKGGGRKGGNSGLGAGREWKWRKGRRLGRGEARSWGEGCGGARTAGSERDPGSAY